MKDFIFPFPDKELAIEELYRDPCFNKIKSDDVYRIVEDAWDIGVNTARDIWNKFSRETDFFTIISKSKLKCTKVPVDRVVGELRYFSEYLSGQNEINLYTKSIELWAKENHISLFQAEKLILSHEYFHYLECNKIGLTSKRYLVPILKIGVFTIGKTGIRALSEIGAHAFAREYYELSGGSL